jgi:hypothetical protein
LKKEELKSQFVRLRAKGLTYEPICIQLNISKPTAIKWNKLYAGQIEQLQKDLMVHFFSDRLSKYEGIICANLEEFRQVKKGIPHEAVQDIFNKKISKKFEKIFAAKIKTVKLKIRKNKIEEAEFTFNDDKVSRGELLERLNKLIELQNY